MTKRINLQNIGVRVDFYPFCWGFNAWVEPNIAGPSYCLEIGPFSIGISLGN